MKNVRCTFIIFEDDIKSCIILLARYVKSNRIVSNYRHKYLARSKMRVSSLANQDGRIRDESYVTRRRACLPRYSEQ